MLKIDWSEAILYDQGKEEIKADLAVLISSHYHVICRKLTARTVVFNGKVADRLGGMIMSLLTLHRRNGLNCYLKYQLHFLVHFPPQEKK